MPRITHIWLKRFHRGPMDQVEEAELVAGQGLRGSADQGGKRQITIITEESWDAVQKELGIVVDPSARRANVVLQGIDLEKSHGRMLRLGECVFRIYGEVRPCERMDQAQQGLRNALKEQWRGGVFAEIIEGGTIRLGDPAELLS
jgi:MOSC domain-containing protein YiiM